MAIGDSSSTESIEYLKLAATIAAPITTAVLGYWLAKLQNRLNTNAAIAEKLLEARLDKMEELLLSVREIMNGFEMGCLTKTTNHHSLIGAYERTKQLMFCAEPVFSKETSVVLSKFLNSCFSEDPSGLVKIKALAIEFNRAYDAQQLPWNEDWDDCFENTPWSPLQIRAQYEVLVGALRRSVNPLN